MTTGLPDRTALEALLRTATSPQAAVQDLLGERLLWWRCCGEAFRTDRSWFDGRGRELRAWLDATAPDRSAGSVASAEHAWLLGRALCAPECGAGEHGEPLAGLSEAWENSGLISPDAAAGPAQPSGHGLDGLSPRVASGLRAVVELVQDLPSDMTLHGPGNMLVIAALLMAGVESRERPVVRVPVVFGRSGMEATGEEGVTGVLELREFRAGPSGLYPDPRTMAGVRSQNGQFAASLGDAWKAAGPRRHGRCVLWRLVLSDEPVPPTWINGPSLGAAFALGLRELLRYPQSRQPSAAWIRSVFYGLRPRTAVTGALDDDRLLRVSGMEAKLLAARRKGLWLVAPEANRLDVAAAPEPSHVRFAADLKQAGRHARRLRTGRLAVVALILVASIAGAFALEQRQYARAEQRAALASRITAEANQLRGTDPSLAAQLDLVAYRMTPDSNPFTNLVADGNAILSAPVEAHRLSATSVAYTPDGRTLASAGIEGTIKLWSVADPARPTLLGEPLANSAVVFDVVFSSDGRTLASGGYDGNVRLWNVADPAHPQALGQPLNADGAKVQSVAFSPDGKTLATGGGDGTIRMWNVADPAHPTELPWSLSGKTGFVVSLAFSPDGRTLAASGNDNTVRLWNLADPSLAPVLLKPPNATDQVYNMAFSPDGKTLATANDGRVWLWNTADPAGPSLRPHYLPHASRTAVSMAFSPDGRTLAAGSDNHSITLWNVTNPSAPVGPLPHTLTTTSSIAALAFSPDGRTLTSGSGDGQLRMWSLPTWHLPGLLTDTKALAFSPNSNILATGEGDGSLTLWNVTKLTDPEIVSRTRIGKSEVYNLAFSPDGRTLVTGDNDGTVALWNVINPARPEATGRTLPAVSDGGPLALSPDGQTLAAGKDSHTIEVWSLSDPAHPARVGQPLTEATGIPSFAVSSDGQTIIATNNNGTIKLWRTANPTQPTQVGKLSAPPLPVSPLALSPDGRTLAAVHGAITELWSLADPAGATTVGTSSATSDVRSLAFSPDGRVLAAGGENGMIRFIDPSRPATPSQPMAGHTARVFSLAFSPDGHAMASTATDRTVRLWNTNPDDAARRICASTRPLTQTEWERYVPGTPFAPPCPT